MTSCNQLQNQSCTRDSTTDTNKSSTNHSTPGTSKYYQLNIDYSPEKESIQLRFTPQDSSKDIEGNLDADEAVILKDIIKPGTNDHPQNPAIELPPVLCQDDKKNRKHKSKAIDVIYPVSIAASTKSLNLNKTCESKDLTNKRKMPPENDAGDYCKDCATAKPKHLKEHSKEGKAVSKDFVKHDADKKAKSKKVQTSKNKNPDELNSESKRKKNKGTYIEQKEIYLATNPNHPFSVALIPGLHVKSRDHSVNVKSSIIKKHRHRKKKHRHHSLDTECKEVHSVPSEPLKKHSIQQTSPMPNKPKGIGFFFLKNKLAWPGLNKNDADLNNHKNNASNAPIDEVNRYKSKNRKKDLMFTAELRKGKRHQHSSTESVDSQCDDIKIIHARRRWPDSGDTVVSKNHDNKRPEEPNVKNSSQDRNKSKEEAELKQKHSKLRRESKNELPKVVSTKIKHKDSKYKKNDVAVNVKIRSSDASIYNQKHKDSKRELPHSHYNNETDNKSTNAEKKKDSSKKRRNGSKHNYVESDIFVYDVQHHHNVKEKPSTVVEFNEVVYRRKTKDRKEKVLDLEDDINKHKNGNNEARTEREPTKIRKNKRVDTESLISIEKKHSKHKVVDSTDKPRKSKHDSKRNRTATKTDVCSADPVEKETCTKSNKQERKAEEGKTDEGKPEDEKSNDTKSKQNFGNMPKAKETYAAKSDDQKKIKISREQLRAFLQEITGNLEIKQSKTAHHDIPNEETLAKINNIRREVSFSHLNLTPVTSLYASTLTSKNFGSVGNTQKSPTLRISASTKEKKITKSKKKGKLSDEKSVVSEAITKKEKSQYVNGKRFQTKTGSTRNVTYSENAEKAKKQASQNGCFTVKGVQPLKERKSNTAPKKDVLRYSPRRLQQAVFSLVEIKADAGSFAKELMLHRPNENLLKDDVHGASSIPISKIYNNSKIKTKKKGDSSSDQTSRSSASAISTVEVSYLKKNSEKRLTSQQGVCDYGYNTPAVATKKGKQPHSVTPKKLHTQSPVKERRLQESMLKQQADMTNEYPENSASYSKPLAERRLQKEVKSSQRIRTQVRKHTKVVSRRKWFAGSSISSREPSTDRRSITEESEIVVPTRLNKAKLSKTSSDLKKYTASAIKSPRLSRAKTVKKNEKTNSTLEASRCNSNFNPSPSSVFSVSTEENHNHLQKSKNVYGNYSGQNRPLQKALVKSGGKSSKTGSGSAVRSRIKQYTEHLHDRRQRHSRESSISSRSSAGKNIVNEINETGQIVPLVFHEYQNSNFKKPFTDNSLHNYVTPPGTQMNSIQTLQDTTSTAKKRPGSISTASEVSASSKESNIKSLVSKNAKHKMTSECLHQNLPHNFFADTESCRRIVQSNLQDTLSGDVTPLTKITEETLSQDSMKYSNLSLSSKNTAYDVNLNSNKASKHSNTTDRKPDEMFAKQKVPKGQNNFANCKNFQTEYQNNQEIRTQRKPVSNSQMEKGFSSPEMHKNGQSGSATNENNKIHADDKNHAAEKVLRMINYESMGLPKRKANPENNNLSAKKSKNKIKNEQNISDFRKGTFESRPIIVFPCAINELEITPVKDSNNEFESSDMESTSSNDSGVRQCPFTRDKKQLNQSVGEEHKNSDVHPLLHNGDTITKKYKQASSSTLNNEHLHEMCLHPELNRETKDCHKLELRNNAHQNYCELSLGADAEKEELKEMKVRRLASSFKKNIMKELQAANQNKVIELIMNNSNEDELKQLDEVIAKNVSSVLKQKVISMLHSEDLSEQLHVLGNVESKRSACEMYSKDINPGTPNYVPESEFGKMKQVSFQDERFRNAIEVESRKSKCLSETSKSESTDNLNSNAQNLNSSCRRGHQSSIDVTQEKMENETTLLKQLLSRFSVESDFVHVESNLDKLLGIINPDGLKNKPPIAKIKSPRKNPPNYLQSPQAMYGSGAQGVNMHSVNKEMGDSKHFTNNANGAQKGLKTKITKFADLDNNKHWENINKRPQSAASRIPKCVMIAPQRSPRQAGYVEMKPRTAPAKSLCSTPRFVSKDQQSRTNLSAFRSHTLLTKLLGVIEKQENKMNTGSSCSTAINSSKNKPSSCLFTKSDKSNSRTSTFEKRKQYGELLRRKNTKSKNESSVGADNESVNQDCIYCYPQVLQVLPAAGKIQEQPVEKVLSSRPPLPKIDSKYNAPSTSRQPTIRVLTPTDIRYGYDGHQASSVDHCQLSCYVCKKLRCCCKKKQVTDEDNSTFTLPFKDQLYPTTPTLIRPVRTENHLKQQHKTRPDEPINKKNSANVCQTLTAAVNHLNIPALLKNKFKSKSAVSLFSRESMFSCDSFSNRVTPNSTVSAFSIENKTVYNSKSSIMLCTSGSDKLFYSIGELKRSMHYKKMVRALHLRKRSASGTPIYNLKSFSSTSKGLLKTIEQNKNDGSANVQSLHKFCNSISNYLNMSLENADKQRQPQTDFKSICQLKVLEARCYVKHNSGNDQFVKRKPAEINRVSSKRLISDKNKYLKIADLNDTQTLKHQNVQKCPLKKLNIRSDTPKPENNQNRFKKIGYSMGERNNRIKNDSTKGPCNKTTNSSALKATNVSKKITNDRKNQYKRTDMYPAKQPRNKANQSTCKPRTNLPRGGSYYKKLTSNCNFIKPNVLKKICSKNNDQIAKRNDNEQGQILKSPHVKKYSNRNVNYKRNNIEMSQSQQCGNKTSYTILNSNKDSPLERKQTKVLKKSDSEEYFKIFAYNSVLKMGDSNYSSTYLDNANSISYENIKKSKLFCCDQYLHEMDEQFYKDFFKECHYPNRSKMTKHRFEKRESKLLNTFFDLEENSASPFKCFEQELYDSKHFLLNPFPTIITWPIRVKVIGPNLPKKQQNRLPHVTDTADWLTVEKKQCANQNRKSFSYWYQPSEHPFKYHSCSSDLDNCLKPNKNESNRFRFQKAACNKANQKLFSNLDANKTQSSFSHLDNCKFIPKKHFFNDSREFTSLYVSDAVWHSDSKESCKLLEDAHKKRNKSHSVRISENQNKSYRCKCFENTEIENKYSTMPSPHILEENTKTCNLFKNYDQNEKCGLLQDSQSQGFSIKNDCNKQVAKQQNKSLSKGTSTEHHAFDKVDIFQEEAKSLKRPRNLHLTLKEKLLQTLVLSSSTRTVNEPARKSTESLDTTTYSISGGTLRSVAESIDSIKLIENLPNEKLSWSVKELLVGPFGKPPLSESKTESCKLPPPHALLNVWRGKLPYSFKETTKSQQEENLGESHEEYIATKRSISVAVQTLYKDEPTELSSKGCVTVINNDIAALFMEQLKQLLDIRLRKTLPDKSEGTSMSFKNSVVEASDGSSNSCSEILSLRSNVSEKLSTSLQKLLLSKDILGQSCDTLLEELNKSSVSPRCDGTTFEELSTLKRQFDISFQELLQLKLNQAIVHHSRELCNISNEGSCEAPVSKTPSVTFSTKQPQKKPTKSIKLLQNLFKKPAKKAIGTTYEKPECSSGPSSASTTEIVHIISPTKSTESSLEGDAEDAYKKHFNLPIKSLILLKQLLKKASKSKLLSKSIESPKSKSAETSPVVSEETLPQVLVEKLSKQSSDPSSKELLLSSLKDLSQQIPKKLPKQSLHNLAEQQSLVQEKPLFDDLLRNESVIFKQKLSQAFFEELQKKSLDKPVNTMAFPCMVLNKQHLEKKFLTYHKACQCSNEETCNDLLTKMSKLPLTTMIKLHNRLTNSKNPQMSFKTLIEDLHKNRVLNKKLLNKVTESQERILIQLQNCECRNNELNTMEINDEMKQNTPWEEVSENEQRIKAEKEITTSKRKKLQQTEKVQMDDTDTESDISKKSSKKQRPSFVEVKTNAVISSDDKSQKKLEPKEKSGKLGWTSDDSKKSAKKERRLSVKEKTNATIPIEKSQKQLEPKEKSDKLVLDNMAIKREKRKRELTTDNQQTDTSLSDYGVNKKTDKKKIPVKPQTDSSLSSDDSANKSLTSTDIASDYFLSPVDSANKKWEGQRQLTPTKQELDDKAKTNELERKAKFRAFESNKLDEMNKTQNDLKKLKDSLTDKELFEKLLDSYEKEEAIVHRLSHDEEFIKSQLESVINTNIKEASPMGAKESINKQKYERRNSTFLGNIQEGDEEKVLNTISNSSEIKKDDEEKGLKIITNSSKIKKDDEEKEIKIIGNSCNIKQCDEEKELRITNRSNESSIASRRTSKTKYSGLKSKVTRLFKQNSSDEMSSNLSSRTENSRRISIDNLRLNENKKTREQASDDNQKVKFFKGGDTFEEEKKMLSISNTSFVQSQQMSSFSPRRSSTDSYDSNMVVQPAELGKCFLRGFRTDYVALDGDTCLLISKNDQDRRMKCHEYRETIIDFSERDSPLEYLLALGFSIDEASNAIKDEDVKNRLFAAITEARIWVNQINTVQGTLLYLVAYKAKPKTMRYFLQLVEAIINNRIYNAVKLDSFLRLLERVEDGDLTMIHILGADKFEDEENEEKIIKKQLRQIFIDVYKIAQYEASLQDKIVTKEGIMLLRIMSAKYRAGLHPHLELIARYIGQGLLNTEVQLEAAMIYLSRLDTADVNLKEFEHYCAINCKKRQREAAAGKSKSDTD